MGKEIMALLVVFVASLLSIAGHLSGAVTQQVVTNPTLIKGLCPNPSLCPSNSASSSTGSLRRYCRQTSDCGANEYCHKFHGMCLENPEPITIPPLPTSTVKCVTDSDCPPKQYCHYMWKICLTVKNVIPDALTTQRPSWYCDTSKDCRIDQVCHETFHACITRPRVSAVRRDAAPPQCQSDSDCGPGCYCHAHFRLCLERKAPKAVTPYKDEPIKKNTCMGDNKCDAGMRCHSLWKLCYRPRSNVVKVQDTSTKKQRQCRLDSDCKRDHFCHRVPSTVVARHRRDVPQRSKCIPLSDKGELYQPPARPQCRTNADCGPNKCCLTRLGICQAYQLPGALCLLEQTDFMCPCSARSYCLDRGKEASPKRIVNKCSLRRPAADHVMKGSHKQRKYKVGKCVPLLGR